MRTGVFVNYNREDEPTPAVAARLAEYLREELPGCTVFFDQDGIVPGEEWARVIRSRIEESALFLCMMGGRWTDGAQNGPADPRKIDDPECWFRREIEWALAQRKEGLQVLPVLVERDRFPEESDLPESVRDLASRQAQRLRSAPHSQWLLDAGAIADVAASCGLGERRSVRAKSRRRRVLAILAVLATVLTIAVVQKFGAGSPVVPDPPPKSAPDRSVPGFDVYRDGDGIVAFRTGSPASDRFARRAADVSLVRATVGRSERRRLLRAEDEKALYDFAVEAFASGFFVETAAAQMQGFVIVDGPRGPTAFMAGQRAEAAKFLRGQTDAAKLIELPGVVPLDGSERGALFATDRRVLDAYQLAVQALQARGAVAAGLQVSAISLQGSPLIGEQVEIRVTATNTGSSDLTEVAPEIDLPPGLELVRFVGATAVDARRSVGSSTAAMPLAKLRPKGLAEWRASVRAKAAGWSPVRVRVACGESGPKYVVDLPVRVLLPGEKPGSDLMLEVVDLQDPVPRRSLATYLVRLTNSGVQDLTGVSFRFTFDGGLSFVAMDDDAGAYRMDADGLGVEQATSWSLAPKARRDVKIVLRTAGAGVVSLRTEARYDGAASSGVAQVESTVVFE